MDKRWVLALLLCVTAASITAPLRGEATKADKPREVPKEVRALEGTYTGSWTMYGLDKGKIGKRIAWTDTMKTSNAEVKGDRAFVTWTQERVLEGTKGTPRKIRGTEGWFLTKEGILGDYFIEMFGQTTRMVRLNASTWSYAVPASAQELMGLGFPKGASGQHVLVKVVTKEQGTETHRISRLSIVTWTDKEGKEQVSQFVSLQGYHKRQP